MTACAGRRWVSPVSASVISTSASAPSGPGSKAVTVAGVTIATDDVWTAVTVEACARNAVRRCTSVTDLAIGSRWWAQSNALSPPPTTTTS